MVEADLRAQEMRRSISSQDLQRLSAERRSSSRANKGEELRSLSEESPHNTQEERWCKTRAKEYGDSGCPH